MCFVENGVDAPKNCGLFASFVLFQHAEVRVAVMNFPFHRILPHQVGKCSK
jgi:hypothetical protein